MQTRNAEKMKRIFLFGIDGATFDIIDPLIDQNKLPVLQRLLKNGVRANLRSTIPPNSSVAWTSLMTGKNPGKHGVYYFLQQVAHSYRRRYINASDIKAETIWSILSRYKKRVGVVNMPMTYPPEEVNGILIAGMLSPSREHVFTWPPSLHMELLSNTGAYPLDHSEPGNASSPDRLLLLERLFEEQQQRARAVEYLMSSREWDVFAAVFTITDRLQHVAWRFRDEKYRAVHPRETAIFEGLIEEAYTATDRIMGRLLKQLPAETVTIVVSDHGFGPVSKNLFIGRWLIQEGYLRLASPFKIRQAVHKIELRRRKRFIGLREPEPWELIDWSRSVAYPAWAGGEEIVMLNMRGREPSGIVEPGVQQDTLKQEIIERLKEIKDPDTGQEVISDAWTAEGLFSGKHIDNAPDIQYRTAEHAYHTLGQINSGPILERPETLTPGLHRENGVLIVQGPSSSVEAGVRIGDASIMDIAPTILRHFDIPIPDDMDGVPIKEAFTDSYNSERTDKKEIAGNYERFAEEFSAEDSEIIHRQLKGLGYIE